MPSRVDHSIRKACTGSVEAARQAGTSPAMHAQNAKARIAPPEPED